MSDGTIQVEPVRAIEGLLGIFLVYERALIDEGPGQDIRSLGLKPAHLAFLRHCEEGEQAAYTRCGQGYCSCGDWASS